jgi:HAD superfamily hydrolase (TIGR01509 family)
VELDDQATEVDVPALRAVILDVDGTLADTERDGHRPAFNAAFAAHHLDVVWGPEEYGRLLKVTGGQRRIAAYLREHGYGDEADHIASEVHQTKTALFRDRILRGEVVARPGVVDLVASLKQAEIRVAVATTARQSWVEPLVNRLLGDGVLDAMVTGDNVDRLKPDPEIYRQALHELDLAADCVLAIEDSATGLQSALAAGLATVVVTNGYTAGQDFTGAIAVQPAFTKPQPLLVDRCRALHRRWWIERRSS